jgi:transposase
MRESPQPQGFSLIFAAAWLGLVPKQISTGDRTILGKISKRGKPHGRATLWPRKPSDRLWAPKRTLTAGLTTSALFEAEQA